jgi:hypothetical protein
VSLLGTRVVPRTERYVAKSVYWSVDRVEVEGANVVIRAQQRFFPARTRRLRLQLLFYSARFSAHDALLGIPIGSAVELRYPNGKVRTFPFRDGAQILLPALPRGSYKVKVRGPGLSFDRPIALSRNQVVKLEVLSWLDIGLVLLFGLAAAIGLVLVGRPYLLSRLPRRRRDAAATPVLPLHLVGEEHSDA